MGALVWAHQECEYQKQHDGHCDRAKEVCLVVLRLQQTTERISQEKDAHLAKLRLLRVSTAKGVRWWLQMNAMERDC